LLALRELFSVQASDDKLMELCGELGSDVAFFILNQPAWCRGRGEIVEPMTWSEPLHGLLVHPGFGVSTPWAYQTYARKPQPGEEGKSLSVGPLRNDLEPPAFSKYLWLPTVKAWFQQQPEVWDAMMSGSGSSVFALTHEAEQAVGLQEKFRAEFGGELFAEPFQRFSKN
jgi:4-diphosphocytidyl-2-C-methyl-D-erythritol kinase